MSYFVRCLCVACVYRIFPERGLMAGFCSTENNDMWYELSCGTCQNMSILELPIIFAVLMMP
jgi:hypothetical protein